MTVEQDQMLRVLERLMVRLRELTESVASELECEYAEAFELVSRGLLGALLLHSVSFTAETITQSFGKAIETLLALRPALVRHARGDTNKPEAPQ